MTKFSMIFFLQLRDLEEELDSYKQTSEKDAEDNFSSLRFPTSTPLPRFSKEDKQGSASQVTIKEIQFKGKSFLKV
jgi:hypothetical protein